MTNLEIFDRVRAGYAHAIEKHPHFAEGPYEALGILGEEYGEVVREITKGQDGWEQRMDCELIDLIAVALRMLKREYAVIDSEL